MGKVLVANGISQLQVNAVGESATVDPRLLCRDAHPDMPLVEQVAVKEHPLGAQVGTTGHVIPLHDDGPREPLPINRYARQDPRGVPGVTGNHDAEG